MSLGMSTTHRITHATHVQHQSYAPDLSFVRLHAYKQVICQCWHIDDIPVIFIVANTHAKTSIYGPCCISMGLGYQLPNTTPSYPQYTPKTTPFHNPYHYQFHNPITIHTATMLPFASNLLIYSHFGYKVVQLLGGYVHLLDCLIIGQVLVVQVLHGKVRKVGCGWVCGYAKFAWCADIAWA